MTEYEDRDPEVALRFLMQLRAAGTDVPLEDAAALGLLASVAMDQYESRGSEVIKNIMVGDWASASEVFSGEPGGDWVQWEVLERDNGEGAIFEFYRYAELYAENWCRLVRKLASAEVHAARPFVHKWFPLLP